MPVSRIVPRAAWGARSPKTIPIHVPIGARSATCVHWDGAVPIKVATTAQAYELMRKDQSYHMDTVGWDDIGYNFLVISALGSPVDGMILEGRGRDIVGAHCKGWNTYWIGVQVAVGGTQKATPAALASVRWLHDGFVVAARHVLGMKGHSDGFPTQCPGPQLLAWVKAGMPKPPASANPFPTPEDTLSAADTAMIQSISASLAKQARTEADRYLVDTARYADLVRREKITAAQITALSAAVAALAAAKPGVDPKALMAAVQSQVKASLAGLSITLTAS